MGQPVQPTFRQQSFRFRNDNGNETTATWLRDVNTNASIRPFVTFRLRFLIQQTLSSANTNLLRSFKLRYSLNNSQYADVSAKGSISTPIRMATSSIVTDDSTTTQQIGSGSFVTGRIDDNNTATINFTSEALSETEIEYVIQIHGNNFNTVSTLDFRVYETNDTVLSNYAVTPRLFRAKRKIILG